MEKKKIDNKHTVFRNIFKIMDQKIREPKYRKYLELSNSNPVKTI